jgi:hypothetical protein
MEQQSAQIIKTRTNIATVLSRWTNSIFSLYSVDDETLILSNNNEELQIHADELFERDNYLVLEGYIGTRARGENWIFCHQQDEVHESRHVKNGQVVTFSGDPIERIQDYVRIRTGREPSMV